jgi:hypothetical protein
MTHPKILTPEQLAERWDTTVGTLAWKRSTKQGPKYIKLGRSVRYRLSDVEEFEATHIIDPTTPKRD